MVEMALLYLRKKKIIIKIRYLLCDTPPSYKLLLRGGEFVAKEENSMKKKCTFSISDIDAGWFDIKFRNRKRKKKKFLPLICGEMTHQKHYL